MYVLFYMFVGITEPCPVCELNGGLIKFVGSQWPSTDYGTKTQTSSDFDEKRCQRLYIIKTLCVCL